MATPNSERDPVCVLIRALIMAFTDHDDAAKKLHIENECLGRVQNIAVVSHLEEYGKLIGTAGVMVKALKVIAICAGNRLGRRTRLNIVDPQVRDKYPGPKFIAAEHWDKGPITELMRATCRAIFENAAVNSDDGTSTTVLSVAIEPTEAMAASSKEIELVLNTIFFAIGKTQGRNEIVVDLEVKENTAV